MRGHSITELLISFMTCRSLKDLQAKLLKAMMLQAQAQAVAVYLPEITGRKLLPMACDGGMPLAKLPELHTELALRRYDELESLRRNPFFSRSGSSVSKQDDLQIALFARSGTFTAHRISSGEAPEKEQLTQAYVFLLSSVRGENELLKDHHAFELLWRAFLSLRPLLQLLEQHQQSELNVTAKSKVRKQQLDAVLAESLVGRSPQISSVREQISRFAQSNYAVLIQGETGTGKELAARALHRLSPFAKGPFVAENISALPDNLIESELFGYKKGAFTGADKDRDGLIKRASGGTLFLDEIGDLSIDLQVKLLRVLQEKTVRPLGAEQDEPVSFRLVTATHVALRDAISKAMFRADLFYRISQLVIALPPLRDRDGDICYLAEFFLREIALNNDDRAKSISVDAMDVLQKTEFRGNVRELQNCMIKAAFLAEGSSVITQRMLLQAMQGAEKPSSLSSKAAKDGLDHLSANDQDVHFLQENGLKQSVANYEQRLLRQTFQRFAGDRGQMAEFLRLPRRTLANKLTNFNCQTMEFEHDK